MSSINSFEIPAGALRPGDMITITMSVSADGDFNVTTEVSMGPRKSADGPNTIAKGVEQHENGGWPPMKPFMDRPEKPFVRPRDQVQSRLVPPVTAPKKAAEATSEPAPVKNNAKELMKAGNKAMKEKRWDDAVLAFEMLLHEPDLGEDQAARARTKLDLSKRWLDNEPKQVQPATAPPPPTEDVNAAEEMLSGDQEAEEEAKGPISYHPPADAATDGWD